MFNSIFVIIGAALWATDTIFRHPMSQQISALSIVFLEHGFALMLSVLSVFLFRKQKIHLEPLPIAGAALIGVLGSALATIFFTMSFSFVNPSVSILLQKTQPITVILLSSFFLGEKLTLRFFIWASIALTAAFFISFPHGMKSVELQETNITGIFLALSAAFFWSISTVVGKVTLKKIPSSQLTLWRFFFGFIALWTVIQFNSQSKIEIPLVAADQSVMLSIFFMALVPGFLGVNLYYRGLTRMKASLATILELTFPLCAVLINSKVLNLPISEIQIVAGIVLLFSITQITR